MPNGNLESPEKAVIPLETRDHLILVHSFPTNSILLRGLTEFLEDLFVVHFVDLPGFTANVPPLTEVTFENYARFLEERIETLELNTYLLGGVSFGFLVVNMARVDHRCRAILAMEPFLNVHGLRLTALQRFLLRSLTKTVVALGASNLLWKSQWFRNRLGRKGPKERMEVLFSEIDARTFFKTATLILSRTAEVRFQDRPYVLLINPDDRTVGHEYVTQAFEREARCLLVIETTVEHYPRYLTKEYFLDRISAAQINSIREFLALQSAPRG
jgi:pimeloyl-ACP methyl ester carboxylesterase